MNNTRKEPLRNCRFRIEIDGIEQVAATEISGLEMSIEALEYREGTDPLYIKLQNGLSKCGKLTVKFGMGESKELYNWFKDGVNGDIKRKNISVILIDMKGNEKVRWNLIEAWPSKYKAPDLNAKGCDIAVETLEIVYEGIERV